MSSATTVHELKTLVLSYHPAIALDTVEEERVEALADAVAAELEIPVYTWALTRGLVRKPTAHPSGETREPLALLTHLRSLRAHGIYVLKDFARHLSDPAVCRAFRDAAQDLAQAKASMWIVGSGHELPADAAAHVVHFPLELPGKKELREVVMTVVRSLRRALAGARCELSKAELERLLRALSGLTLNQARQAVARAVLRDGVLDADDIPFILEHKAELLGHEGLLEYLPAEDNACELGGFAGLKAWLERAQVGFSGEARALSLPAPRGILLVGVQGCGKSLAAKFVARSWGLPLVKLDAGRLYDEVGRREREEPPARDRARRVDGAGRALDRRAREELRELRLLRVRRRHQPAHLRDAAHLAAGEEEAGLRGRDRERRVPAAAGAAAQGSLRRDLLRGPAGRRGARGDPPHPPRAPQAGRRALRPRRLADAIEG